MGSRCKAAAPCFAQTSFWSRLGRGHCHRCPKHSRRTAGAAATSGLAPPLAGAAARIRLAAGLKGARTPQFIRQQTWSSTPNLGGPAISSAFHSGHLVRNASQWA